MADQIPEPKKSTMGELGLQALKELHAAISSHLGIGQGDGTKYIPNQAQTVDQAVDEAVKGAPKSSNDY